MAGEIFSCAYEPRVQAWADRTTDPRMHVVCPFSGIQVDASITAFVDDLFRVCIVDNCRASHVALTVAQNDRALDEELEAIESLNAQERLNSVMPFGTRVVEPSVASLLVAIFCMASFFTLSSTLDSNPAATVACAKKETPEHRQFARPGSHSVGSGIIPAPCE